MPAKDFKQSLLLDLLGLVDDLGLTCHNLAISQLACSADDVWQHLLCAELCQDLAQQLPLSAILSSQSAREAPRHGAQQQNWHSKAAYFLALIRFVHLASW